MIILRDILLYTNKLYSKILHPVTDEVKILRTRSHESYSTSTGGIISIHRLGKLYT
jgi:hypothetical protein